MSSTPAPDAFEVGGFVLLSGVSRDPLAEQWIARSRSEGPLVRVVRLTADTLADSEATAAFVANLDAIKDVEHPGIVRVIETRRSDDGVLGVLELFEGVTLRELCDASSEKKLPLAIVLRIAHDVASALAALGAEGIAHGDVSPSTILLLAGGVAVLVPSGLAVAVCRATDGAPRARLAYKAPEQLEGRSADASADVFGLAASLLEALAGRPAFAGAGEELRASIARGRAALGEAPADVPRALFAVLSQSLESDPKLRPAAARALARSLEDAAGTTAATRFELAALISERAGRDIAALRFEVELLTGKTDVPKRPAAQPPARAAVPAPRPELDAENTPRSGPPPAPPKPSTAVDPNADLFEDTQPSLAKLRARQHQSERRRRTAIIGLAVAGLALVGFAISARLRAADEPAASVPVPAATPVAEPVRTSEVVPPPPAEPPPEPEPEAVAVSEPASPPSRPARPAPRAPAPPVSEPDPAPAPAPPAKPATTENPNPPRAEPPAYTAPSKPPPAPTVEIPAGI